MDFKDVILTASESATLAAKHLEKYKCLDTFTRERDKAQCLKFLNILKRNYQLPKDTIVYPNLLIMSGQQVDALEKLLKDNNND